MATAILIFLWVANELSHDNFHANGDRIYAMFDERTVNGQLEADYSQPSALGPVLKATLPAGGRSEPLFGRWLVCVETRR